MDLVTSTYIHRLTKTTPFTAFWQWSAEYSAPFFVGILFCLWAVFIYNRTRDYWIVPARITISLIVSISISYILRKFIEDPRPFVEGSFKPLVAHASNYSFPSNHATATAVFCVVFLWFGYQTIGTFLVTVTGIVGIARVVTGLHSPMDIVAGWILGGGTAVLFCYYQLPPFKWVPDLFRSDLNTSFNSDDIK